MTDQDYTDVIKRAIEISETAIKQSFASTLNTSSIKSEPVFLKAFELILGDMLSRSIIQEQLVPEQAPVTTMRSVRGN